MCLERAAMQVFLMSLVFSDLSEGKTFSVLLPLFYTMCSPKLVSFSHLLSRSLPASVVFPV